MCITRSSQCCLLLSKRGRGQMAIAGDASAPQRHGLKLTFVMPCTSSLYVEHSILCFIVYCVHAQNSPTLRHAPCSVAALYSVDVSEQAMAQCSEMAICGPFRSSGYNNMQSQLPEKQPVCAVPETVPCPWQQAHFATPLHSCKALIMSACSCACSDIALCRQAARWLNE